MGFRTVEDFHAVGNNAVNLAASSLANLVPFQDFTAYFEILAQEKMPCYTDFGEPVIMELSSVKTKVVSFVEMMAVFTLTFAED
jgi:hypothetical protein